MFILTFDEFFAHALRETFVETTSLTECARCLGDDTLPITTSKWHLRYTSISILPSNHLYKDTCQKICNSPCYHIAASVLPGR